MISAEWTPVFNEMENLLGEASSRTDIVSNEEKISSLRYLNSFFAEITRESRTKNERDEAFRESMRVAGKIAVGLIAVVGTTAAVAYGVQKSSQFGEYNLNTRREL